MLHLRKRAKMSPYRSICLKKKLYLYRQCIYSHFATFSIGRHILHFYKETLRYWLSEAWAEKITPVSNGVSKIKRGQKSCPQSLDNMISP